MAICCRGGNASSELWLEARRLGDRRHWIEEDIPGEVADRSGRDLCFPVSQDELETTPNTES